jgi:hypothetical protein
MAAPAAIGERTGAQCVETERAKIISMLDEFEAYRLLRALEPEHREMRCMLPCTPALRKGPQRETRSRSERQNGTGPYG